MPFILKHVLMGVGGGVQPDPGDENDGSENPPSDPPPPVCSCAAELAELRREFAELEQVMVDAAKAANDRLTKLENAPAPVLDGDEILEAILPRIDMARSWGHSHGLGVKK